MDCTQMRSIEFGHPSMLATDSPKIVAAMVADDEGSPPPPPTASPPPSPKSSATDRLLNDHDVEVPPNLMWHKLATLFKCKCRTVRELRICCIMLGFYHVIVAHFMLFVMLMSLVHAEQMVAFLDTDIADHKEREGYYDMPMHASGVTVNTLRFGFAANLATSTRNLICVGLALVVAYAICCGLVVFGAIRYRAGCMVPWLLMHGCGGVVAFVVCIAFRHALIDALEGEEWEFWVITLMYSTTHLGAWQTMYDLYTYLQDANKKTKSATVAIPYAAKGKIPYHFCKENMYLGSGGHKHTLVDKCDPNYVV